MFDGFTKRDLPTGRGTVFARVGGSGPPLLLLHGYPQTHLTWWTVAELLADRYTVVAADLPGYGASFRPVPTPDHAAHAKRAIADDLVQAMAQLGHDAFAVAGHDRGGRVAYRMALDHPERVVAAAVFDVVPTGEVWARADAALALGYWHWSFLAQPAPLPERLIAADPDAFFDFHVRALGLGRAPGRYPADLMAIYRELLDDAGTVQAICEDYRAAVGVDRDHDDADRGRRRIECPLLALWSASGALPRFYGDVLDVWRPWARHVSGRGLEASHFLVEDQPEQVADLLSDFSGDRHPTIPRMLHIPTQPPPGDDRDGSEDRSCARRLRRLGELGRPARPAACRRPRDRVREPAARPCLRHRPAHGPAQEPRRSGGAGRSLLRRRRDERSGPGRRRHRRARLRRRVRAGARRERGRRVGARSGIDARRDPGPGAARRRGHRHLHRAGALPPAVLRRSAAEQAARMAITQRPVTEEALFEPAGDRALWRSVPSWFVFGELDHNIPAAAHRIMAERAGARRTVEVPGASHVVGISHPDEVANVVLEAVAERAAVTS